MNESDNALSYIAQVISGSALAKYYFSLPRETYQPEAELQPANPEP